jgi:glycosyltransferase involved in cell wall biosynthesis
MNDLYVACIPIYNDWHSARDIITRLQAQATSNQRHLRIVLVDDGSSEPPPFEEWAKVPALNSVILLRLRRNLGHQRSIAIGLTYIYQHLPCRGVIVMDGDGEDAPEDVEILLKRLDQDNYQHAVFAKRMKRTESFLFRFFYLLFRLIHFVLTGRKVEVGNFSVLPWNLLGRLVGVSEVWNHYAAAVEKARLPTTKIPIARGHRLHGKSKMNFVSLVTHGLSAISVFSDEIGVRLLVALAGFFSVLLVGFVALLCAGPVIGPADWFMGKIETLLLLLAFCLFMAIAFVLIVLQGRNLSSFLPLRDYEYFILETRKIGRAS